MLIASSRTTTLWVGAIGVSPASTTKVTSADRTASATAMIPRSRTKPPGAGDVVADTRSAVAVWPTLVMQFCFAQNRVYGTSTRADGRSPASPLMLLYNNVAELRQFRGW
jgi:hypothetical protein